MTPAALVVFGAAAFFVYRLRYVVLSLVHDLFEGMRLARENRRKEERRQHRKRTHVQFYTVEQVWGEDDDEDERKSA